jgi:hypothetical protein
MALFGHPHAAGIAPVARAIVATPNDRSASADRGKASPTGGAFFIFLTVTTT